MMTHSCSIWAAGNETATKKTYQLQTFSLIIMLEVFQRPLKTIYCISDGLIWNWIKFREFVLTAWNTNSHWVCVVGYGTLPFKRGAFLPTVGML